MVWLFVTFKFVCFDGIEGKKLVDEVGREKGEMKKENRKGKRKKELSSVWNVLECGGSGGEKEERRKKRKKVRVHVWRRKKEGKKEEGNMDKKIK